MMVSPGVTGMSVTLAVLLDLERGVELELDDAAPGSGTPARRALAAADGAAEAGAWLAGRGRCGRRAATEKVPFMAP